MAEVDKGDIRQYFNRRLGHFKNDYANVKALHMELKQYILPAHGRFEKGGVPFKVDRSVILNNTAEQSLKVHAAGFLSHGTSPADVWVNMVATNPELRDNEEVREYADVFRDLIMRVLSTSNFYSSAPSVYKELLGFGASLQYMMDDDRDLVRFFNATVGEFYFGLNARGDVDSVYREFTKTVHQLIMEFGKDNVSAAVLQRDESGHCNASVRVVHVVEPYSDKLPKGARPTFRFPYIDIYYEASGDQEKHDKVLQVGGHYEFPCLLPRATVVSTDAWAHGVGEEYLADAKQLQDIELTLARARHAMADPLKLVPEWMQEQITENPGGYLFYGQGDDPSQVRALESINYPIRDVQDNIREITARIENGFNVPLFNMMQNLDKQNMTIPELNARQQENAQNIGPSIQWLEDGYWDPLVNGVAAKILRLGIGPEIPDVLRGEELAIEYVTRLHQARKAAGISRIERVLAFAAGIVQTTGDPSYFDKIDLDGTIDEVAKRAGMPSKLLRSDEGVSEIRGAKQQQEQQQQMLAQAEQAAAVGKTLSETQTQEGNALDDIRQLAGNAQ